MGKHAMTRAQYKAAKRKQHTTKVLATAAQQRPAAALALAILTGASAAVAGAPGAPLLATVQAATTAQAATVPGADVSHWNGSILWATVKGSIQVPIVKQSGSDTGSFYVDSKYRTNLNAVRAAGYGVVGHYYFNGALDGAAAAERFSANLQGYRAGDILAYDAEGSWLSVTNAYRFVTRLHQLRPDARIWIYMSSSFTTSSNWSSVQGLGYVDLWVARYGGNPSTGPWPVWAAWQWTSTGRVAGISGNVDLNLVATSALNGTIGGSTPATGTGVAEGIPYGTYLGYDVATTQRLLNANGASLAVDGWYGALTRAAVRTYQSTHGLSVDGYAGPATQASLRGTTGSQTSGVQVTSNPSYWKLSVSSVQRLLNGWGYNLAVDNVRGSATDIAVRSFQKNHGLTVDGIVGANTVSALYPSTRTVQQRLNAHGYHLVEDNIKGYRTRAAIISFQRSHGLYPDAIVGPYTWSALGY